MTLAIYTYFLTTIMGRQITFSTPSCPKTDVNASWPGAGRGDDEVAVYGPQAAYLPPLFPFLEFVFYMGWLKVAESIMNPLGEGKRAPVYDAYSISIFLIYRLL